MYVDLVEGTWLGLNILTAIVVTLALRRSWRRRSMAREMGGSDFEARAIVAGGAVRHQIDRLLVAILFIVVVLPGLTIDRPTPLTPLVFVLLLVPAVNLFDSLADRRDWRRLDNLDEATA